MPAASVSVEAVLGLLATFFIGFSAPLLLVGALFGARTPAMITLLALGFTGWAAIFVARLASQALEGERQRSFRLGNTRPDFRPLDSDLLRIPLALAMVARLPRIHRFIRPWLGLWWLLHFTAAAFLGHLAATRTLQEFDVNKLLLSIPLAILMHFAFLFAANLYLLLAIAILVPWPKLWLQIWKQRFLIDFGLAILLLSRF